MKDILRLGLEKYEDEVNKQPGRGCMSISRVPFQVFCFGDPFPEPWKFL